MKANWFTDYIAKNREALIERLDKALQWQDFGEGLIVAHKISDRRPNE